MRSRFYLYFLGTLCALLACNLPSILPTATPLPLPTELATTPFPEGSQLGGLEAIFASVESTTGIQNSQCYALFRFHQDGLVLGTSQRCLDAPTGVLRWSDSNQWFTRDKADSLIMRGDYSRLDHRLWLRLIYNYYGSAVLLTYRGEYCNNKMVLGLVTHPAPVGVTWEYIQLDEMVPTTAAPAALSTASIPLDPTPSLCHAAGFKPLHRSDIVLAGGQAVYRIQTDLDEPCTLSYVTPDGTASDAEGTGTITADSEGVCAWQWEVGDAAGDGIVTVTIDEITQDFTISIK